MSQDCEHLIRHMLVVEPEKRLSLMQIAKHKWLSNTPPVDTGPQRELQLNKTVIDHMLQLPGLNQNMIVHSIKNNTFDHIYAIYNLLVDKLHQRTMNFQSKISQRQNGSEQQSESDLSIGDADYTRAPRINERSESFNENLVTQLNSDIGSKSSEIRSNREEEPFNCRRESFNENCLRSVRDNVNEKRKSVEVGVNEEVGSPFVSMPTIPAVYLVGDGENPPLEKFGEMDLDQGEEACSLNVPSTSTTTGYSSMSSSGDRYLTVRRHTVGPGDPAHEQVLETHYINQAQDPNVARLLPHTNLPLHLPLLSQQNPHYFGGKDPHLLKPPIVMNAAGGFGRRASGIFFSIFKSHAIPFFFVLFYCVDGGANLHMTWGTPGSHEQLSVMSTSSSGNPSLSSGTTTQPLEHSQPALDELSDPYAVAR